MSRMGKLGVIGYFADGTPAVMGPNGQPVPAPANAVPPAAGAGNVQGRGLVFQYQTPTIASLASGAAQSVTIQFDQNSVFNWLRSTIAWDVAGDTSETSTYPLVTIQITDSGNGMSFMNGPIPLVALSGDGRLPYVLPTPQLIQANASYIFAFNNYSGTGSTATTYTNLRFQLHGYRIFNTGQ